jgi:hypothetical protein
MSMNEEIKSKLIGFAAAIFDAEECAQEIVDFWAERIENLFPKWISVTNEMPPRREDDSRYSIEVQTIDDCGFQMVDWFDFEYGDWIGGEVEHITHWRHLPAPPKK